ncbi:peptidase [Mycobacterium sp. CBMA293]|uniref:Neutral zinc metallopeptidase n=1 Tax=Mycolicibacterium sp. CBMA 213 TaxID=1968788 RepID=A0A1S6GKH7_9MYCO|nr:MULTISPECIES: neutral zinc metallopeptidase [unclassified Mycolicibacterium]AQS22374.1 Putative neutral zinc metallopeptidase [Mycolicibacterium sp. CBMA 213]MUL48435.1 peptidase [Mycolicibacterium sp. CBMA 360]MUL62293.1 peptidase [Mycolicibacterium sp. CBMA 335]MUM04430.1 peptidase [Mycolicibacterium sp. CBMA 213]MUM14693.1 peptidase [Mycolicibacterium sp. CBMA 293]
MNTSTPARRGLLRTVALTAAACATLLLPACTGTVIAGHSVSPINDPNHAGDLPAADGPSGVKQDAPAATGTVQNTDHGDVDKLVLLAVNDLADFWQTTYPTTDFKGKFTPVPNYASYDSRDPNSPQMCGGDTYDLVNAFYCPPDKLMAWDRGVLVPAGRKYFGDISVAGLIGHEYGHAIQRMAKIVTKKTPVVVLEQQADCFGGAYMHYIAAGDSKRFQVSTGDGLNHVLAGLITLRDPTMGPNDGDMLEDGHGTALDRVSAFQIGFNSGPQACGKIDMADIERRREGLPMELDDEPNRDTQRRGTDVPLDQGVFTVLVNTLNAVFQPKNPPKVSFDAASCADAKGGSPASYCPATNTIVLDLPELQKLGKPADEIKQKLLLQGDNTALSVAASRYMLAVQHEKGVNLTGGAAALRTACLTAVAERDMAKPVKTADGQNLTLAAGDLDKAVAGLLMNGDAATDVNGDGVLAGFTRIAAFRAGLIGDQDSCYDHFA